MLRFVFIATLSLLLSGKGALAQDLTMPAGMRMLLEERSDLASYALPVERFQNGDLPVQVFEGEMVAQVWRIEGRGLTTLQLLAPLRRQISDLGFDIRLDCDTQICGGFDFRFNTRVLPGPEMYVDLTNFRFLSASQSDSVAISILISRSSTAAYLQVIRVGDAVRGNVVTGDTPAVVGQPATPDRPQGPFGQTLETRGRVVLEDLTFETGKSALGDGTFESLKKIAAYLAANPGRKIALVGHTDSTGGLEVNIAVSRKRAVSVLEQLVAEYGVKRAQLEAGGMGYLAPIISNLTEAGRQANRRVEAVLISTE